MNDLQKAYVVLGLEPGASMESIMRRYKRLIMVWHPDRASTAEHKEFAEQEMKKINNAKDTLTKHFGSGGEHKENNCSCQSPVTEPVNNASHGPGPGYHRDKSDQERRQEEQQAKRRDDERVAREQQQAQASEEEDEIETAEEVADYERVLKDEKLRWRVSLGLVTAFAVLEIFGAFAIGLKGWSHKTVSWWQQTLNTSKPDIPNAVAPGGSPPSQLPPYYDTPTGDRSNWKAEQAQRDEETNKRVGEKRSRDLYLVGLELDKYEKVIEHCKSELSEIAVKLESADISNVEKQKLIARQEFQEKNLRDAEDSLVYYRKKQAAIDVSDAVSGARPPVEGDTVAP
ncbi:MAG: J domain-containing protein [Candidatus Obscuribacterales bacterium]|nr:J domain-containing protein [Candidatus Obscuribacterales bacterium]MBY0552841.1 J domain-containing protein [Candidatus Obscuribacterales bacterium]